MIENMASNEIATRLLNTELRGATFDPEYCDLQIIDNFTHSCKLVFRYDWQHRTEDPEEYAVILTINRNDLQSSYDLIISEDLGDRIFYASGSISKDPHDDGILVNGVIQGALKDPYGDGFNIRYDMYSHILEILNFKL
jgi:hypothetical protein